MRESCIAPEHRKGESEFTDVMKVFATSQVCRTKPISMSGRIDVRQAAPQTTHELPCWKHIREKVWCETHG